VKSVKHVNREAFFCENIITWGQVHVREFPWRSYRNGYRVLVSEVLLVQTFAQKVVPVYNQIVSIYPGFYDLAHANINDIKEIIMPLGLIYRASLLVEIAYNVVHKFNGQLPNDKSKLMELKGIGNYIASTIQCFAFNESVSIVDANVVRVLSRYFGLDWPLNTSKQRAIINAFADDLVSNIDDALVYNYALLDFGALVCKHYNPLCSECPVWAKCSMETTSSELERVI